MMKAKCYNTRENHTGGVNSALRKGDVVKRVLAVGAVVLAALAVRAGAAPSVVVSSFAQRGGRVFVDYSLSGEPAIVTVDFLTNGVTIGESNFANVGGDVNKIVTKANGSIVWHPAESWPGTTPATNCTAKVTAWATNSPPDYFVYDILTRDKNFYVSTNALPLGGLSNRVYRTSKLVMRRIPAANVEWRMGSPLCEVGRADTEIPHLVTLTEDFYIAIFEMTQAQYANTGWSYAKGFNYSGEDADIHPAEMVNYWHIRGSTCVPTNGRSNPGSFIADLRGKSGVDFDLPTEAQWEFACRAGTLTALNSGRDLAKKSSDANAMAVAWTQENQSEGQDVAASHSVGLRAPNAWGLYDMHGNVHEWCVDWWAPYPTDDATNPAGGTANYEGMGRALRGGGWGWSASAGCRSASRGYDGDKGALKDRGFRLICPVSLKW